MRFLHLIVRNALRNRLRTFLTLGGIAFLMFVLIFMMTALTEISAWEGAGDTHLRIVVQHATALGEPLDPALENYLRSDEIAKRAQHLQKMNWFGGIWKDPKDWFANFAVDHTVHRELWSEFKVADDQYARLCELKTGTIVGNSLMKRFDWKVGQRITLKGTIYPCDADLEIVGTFSGPNPRDEEQLFFRWDYFDELLRKRNVVSTWWMKARSAEDVPALKTMIDGRTRNSSDPTETMTQKQFGLQFMQMMGSVKAIVIGVATGALFILTLMTANTMAMSARERVTEVAVMRTLGYTGGQILTFFIAESLIVTMAGALLSLGAAYLMFNVMHLSPSKQYFPYYFVAPVTMATALGGALVCGFLSSAVPAIQAARRSIVDGLRQVA